MYIIIIILIIIITVIIDGFDEDTTSINGINGNNDIGDVNGIISEEVFVINEEIHDSLVPQEVYLVDSAARRCELDDHR